MSRVLHGHQLVEVPFSFVAEEERLQLSTSAPRDLSVLVDAFKQMVLFFFYLVFIVVLGREVGLIKAILVRIEVGISGIGLCVRCCVTGEVLISWFIKLTIQTKSEAKAG